MLRTQLAWALLTFILLRWTFVLLYSHTSNFPFSSCSFTKSPQQHSPCLFCSKLVELWSKFTCVWFQHPGISSDAHRESRNEEAESGTEEGCRLCNTGHGCPRFKKHGVCRFVHDRQLRAEAFKKKRADARAKKAQNPDTQPGEESLPKGVNDSSIVPQPVDSLETHAAPPSNIRRHLPIQNKVPKPPRAHCLQFVHTDCKLERCPFVHSHGARKEFQKREREKAAQKRGNPPKKNHPPKENNRLLKEQNHRPKKKDLPLKENIHPTEEKNTHSKKEDHHPKQKTHPLKAKSPNTLITKSSTESKSKASEGPKAVITPAVCKDPNAKSNIVHKSDASDTGRAIIAPAVVCKDPKAESSVVHESGTSEIPKAVITTVACKGPTTNFGIQSWDDPTTLKRWAIKNLSPGVLERYLRTYGTFIEKGHMPIAALGGTRTDLVNTKRNKNNAPSPLAEFQLFSQLPQELQDQIWMIYMNGEPEQCMIALRRKEGKLGQRFGFKCISRLQTALVVNRSLRKTALRQYKPAFGTRNCKPPAHFNYQTNRLFICNEGACEFLDAAKALRPQDRKRIRLLAVPLRDW